MIKLLITLGYHIFYTILCIIIVGKVDTSYSDTFYKLKGWKKLLFWGWILSFTVPMVYYFRDKSILACIGSFLPLLVLFNSYTVGHKLRSALHVIGATGGILIMLLGFIIELSNWKDWNIFNYAVILMVIELIVILPIGKFKKGIKNHTFWIEFAMIVTPLAALFIHESKKNEKAT